MSDTARPVPAVLAPRHRPGRGSGVSAAERREIQLAALLEGLTIQALADRHGRNRRTITRVLAHPSYVAMREKLDAEQVAEARQVLAAHRTVAAQAWTEALAKAAQRGDHRPSRDLLYVTRTVDPPSPLGGGPSVIVNVGQIVTTPDGKRHLPEFVPIIEGEVAPSEADE